MTDEQRIEQDRIAYDLMLDFHLLGRSTRSSLCGRQVAVTQGADATMMKGTLRHCKSTDPIYRRGLTISVPVSNPSTKNSPENTEGTDQDTNDSKQKDQDTTETSDSK